MAWFKVDDGFWSHPKVMTMSAEATSLWVRAGSYSCQHLTDGFIASGLLHVFGTTAAADELVAAGLWIERSSGYEFHDWGEYQETSEEVKSRREVARDKKRRQRRAASGRFESEPRPSGSPAGTEGGSPSGSPSGSPGDRPGGCPPGTTGGTPSGTPQGSPPARPGDRPRGSHAVPTRPDPTRPDRESPSGDSPAVAQARPLAGAGAPAHVGAHASEPETPATPALAAPEPAPPHRPALVHENGQPTPAGIIHEWERASGTPLTESTRTAMRLAASQCLRAGHDPTVIGQGIADWATSKITATSQIPSFVDRAAVRPRLAPAGSGQSNAEQWLALGREMDAQENRA